MTIVNSIIAQVSVDGSVTKSPPFTKMALNIIQRKGDTVNGVYPKDPRTDDRHDSQETL